MEENKNITQPEQMRTENQINELKELTNSLIQSVQLMQSQAFKNNKVEDSIADLKATTRALMITPNNVLPSKSNNQGDCGCNGSCIGEDCCCFEIVLAKVRAAQPQIEPADSGDVGPFINALEVQIYATNQNIGFLWPGLATTMDLRAEGLPPGPGPWVVIERVINRVYVKKGNPVTEEVFIEIREHDEGLERPVGMKDEIGEGTGQITLDCCMPKIYPAMPIEIPLSYGGLGKGMIQAAFYARRL
jgi:hypothetical protein